jgi:hypothetical protein
MAADRAAGSESKKAPSGAPTVAPVFQTSQPLKASLHQLCTSALGGIGGGTLKNTKRADLASVASEATDIEATSHRSPPAAENQADGAAVVETASVPPLSTPYCASSIQIDVADPGNVDFYFFRAAAAPHRCARCDRCRQPCYGCGDDTSATTARSFG